MELGKHRQNVAASRWQGQLLPSTVSPSLPGPVPVSPSLSCPVSPSLSRAMSPSLGHPCSPGCCAHPAQAVVEGAAEGDGMGWACGGHPAPPSTPPVCPACRLPLSVSSPSLGASQGQSPASHSSPPHSQPQSWTPNPPGVPAAAEGGARLGTMPGFTPAKPHPCRVALGAASVDGAAVADQWGMRAGTARKQRIKKRRNRIWASSRARSLPPFLLSSFQ